MTLKEILDIVQDIKLEDAENIICDLDTEEMGCTIGFIDCDGYAQLHGSYWSCWAPAEIPEKVWLEEDGERVHYEQPENKYYDYVKFRKSGGTYVVSSDRKGCLSFRIILPDNSFNVGIIIPNNTIVVDNSCETEKEQLVREMVELRLKEVKILYEYKGEITNQSKWNEEMGRINRVKELFGL